MPHAVIVDAPPVERLLDAFVPWKENLPGGTRLEARNAYLRHDRKSLLVEVVCMEVGPPQEFFVIIEEKKQQLTVRCHSTPSPYRTPGVHELVLRVARFVLSQGGRLERTNLAL